MNKAKIWWNVLMMLSQNNSQTRIVYRAKISLKNEDKITINEQADESASKYCHSVKELLKGVFLNEGNGPAKI